MPKIELDAYEIHLLMEALDSHEYWQLAEEDERNDGYVYLPGDVEDPSSKMYVDPADASSDDDERHEEIRDCRALAEKLRAALAASESRTPAE